MTRIAKSVETLGSEVHLRSPQTVLYYYDDTVHRDSDHDPNLHGVVTAIDIMAGHGLDLGQLAEEIRQAAKRRKDVKYVIYNRRIASRNTGWEWVAYTGKNPHTDHIHVSVGVGRDGYGEPPYDSTESWLDMALDSKDVAQTLVKTAVFPYDKPTQSLGTTWLSTQQGVTKLLVEAEADKARDAILLTAIQAVAGGSADTQAIVVAINAARDNIKAALEAEVTELRQENLALRHRLAEAFAD